MLVHSIVIDCRSVFQQTLFAPVRHLYRNSYSIAILLAVWQKPKFLSRVTSDDSQTERVHYIIGINVGLLTHKVSADLPEYRLGGI